MEGVAGGLWYGPKRPQLLVVAELGTEQSTEPDSWRESAKGKDIFLMSYVYLGSSFLLFGI
ncbi:homeobox-DDT domain protein RLT3-like isoform X1 [Gossypium australe]|uniref:Homeobox-DDT domain protein RLT3-like isoform X1 n=1 Tax=Gossypium australe TaxID=47621 RepID=A0A5B6VYQ7_9ROSI|nr:homeobox-DDT domain protein RLT3-like isoform X1 [Gossypium australe]